MHIDKWYDDSVCGLFVRLGFFIMGHQDTQKDNK